MAYKDVKIKLKDNRVNNNEYKPNEDFIVLELTNTVDYKIQQILTETQVKDLCNINGYIITIK